MGNDVMTINGGGLSVHDLKSRIQMVHQAMKSVMREGAHYGIIPGCQNTNVACTSWKRSIKS